jgi:hypothetical protein
VSVTATPARPEPVLIAAGAASAITTLIGLATTILVAAHVLTPAGSATLGPTLAAAIPTVLGAVGTIVAAFHARGRVTPLSDPRLLGAVVDLVTTGEQVATAVVAARPAGAQRPGVPDHAASTA